MFVDTRVSDQTPETLFQRTVFENVFVTEDDKLVIEHHDLSERSVYERRDDDLQHRLVTVCLLKIY